MAAGRFPCWGAHPLVLMGEAARETPPHSGLPRWTQSGLSLWFARVWLLEQPARVCRVAWPPRCALGSPGASVMPQAGLWGPVHRGPSVCGGTHAICLWHGVTCWAPLEESLQSSRLVARALIIRSNCGLGFHKPGGCTGGGQAAKVTPKSLLNRWCER